MDRCAVLVDAGYLLGAAGTLISSDANRETLDVDYGALAEALIRAAEDQTGLPVLRLLWYDAAINSRARPEHQTLGVLPDVKVRLGELVVRGGRLQQKGVDSYLQRDLTTLARNQAVADVVLLGGDEDLRRAVEEAQDHGTRVHLWAVEAAATEFNQSRGLIAEADRRWVIPSQWIREFVTVRHREPASEAHGSGEPEASVVPSDAMSIEAGAATSSLATPASPEDLERLAASFGHEPTPPENDARGWSVTNAPRLGDDLPHLHAITGGREAWGDNEEDRTTPGREPEGLGRTFGTRWAARASADQLDVLVQLRPRAPRHLDGELLGYANRLGVNTWDDEPAKQSVRAGFWNAIVAAHETAIRD